MALFYEDLIEPTIVKQVSKEVAYCRCTRSKNLPFCDGSHEGTNIQPHILKFDQPTTIAICRCYPGSWERTLDGSGPPWRPCRSRREDNLCWKSAHLLITKA